MYLCIKYRHRAMKIKIDIERRKLGIISIIDSNTEAGHLRFTIDDKRILRATHTIVKPNYQGKGLAQKLVDTLVSYSIEKGYLIDPICSYIEKLSQREGVLSTRLETHTQAEEIIREMQTIGNSEKAQASARYFKTGKGEYAEGDIFLGLKAADITALLRKYSPLSERSIIDLWQSPYHDARSLGYAAISKWMTQADNDTSISHIYDLYLEYAKHCNNWDLVDCSAPIIIGKYWANKSAPTRQQSLIQLAQSDNLWIQRIAIVGTLGLIKEGIYEDTLLLVEQLKGHKHDLIHKAMGWMLREVGKRINQNLLRDWLKQHKLELPRTTLRYAIERFSTEERQAYLSKN